MSTSCDGSSRGFQMLLYDVVSCPEVFVDTISRMSTVDCRTCHA